MLKLMTFKAAAILTMLALGLAGAFQTAAYAKNQARTAAYDNSGGNGDGSVCGETVEGASQLFSGKGASAARLSSGQVDADDVNGQADDADWAADQQLLAAAQTGMNFGQLNKESHRAEHMANPGANNGNHGNGQNGNNGFSTNNNNSLFGPLVGPEFVFGHRFVLGTSDADCNTTGVSSGTQCVQDQDDAENTTGNGDQDDQGANTANNANGSATPGTSNQGQALTGTATPGAAMQTENGDADDPQCAAPLGATGEPQGTGTPEASIPNTGGTAQPGMTATPEASIPNTGGTGQTQPGTQAGGDQQVIAEIDQLMQQVQSLINTENANGRGNGPEVQLLQALQGFLMQWRASLSAGVNNGTNNAAPATVAPTTTAPSTVPSVTPTP